MKKTVITMMSAFYLMSCQIESVDVNPDSLASSSSGARKVTGSLITTYEVKPEIMGYFQHWWQNDPTSKSVTTGIGKDNAAISCAATSYMMAANCIAGYKSRSYGANATKQKQILNVVGGNASLQSLNNYGNNQDASFITSSFIRKYDRTEAKNTLEDALTNDKFILVAVNAYVIGGATLVHTDPFYSTSLSTNPDLDGSAAGQKYVTGQPDGTKSGAYTAGGHLFLIIAIAKNADGSGIVTYVDPISMNHSPSNRKYVSYTRLLDAMKACSAGGDSYPFVTITSK